jgi:putative tryptophan/tyrosine transport system substrate-binding protein
VFSQIQRIKVVLLRVNRWHLNCGGIDAVKQCDQLGNAFKEAINAVSGAIAVTPNPLTNSNRKRIAELAAQKRLPVIYPRAYFVESGGLISYRADRIEPYKRAASMIDKILKRTKPADIPVEQPTKFELVINLNTTKQIGLTIPPNVLARANTLIK